MLLSHLYKNTALFAVAAFIVMGVGLSSHTHESIQTQAAASEVTLTITMGNNKMWTSSTASSYSITSGRAYTFSSGNLTWAGNNGIFPLGQTTTANGWIANTGAATYGRINSIVVSLGTSTNLDSWVSTTTPITNVVDPTTIANTVKLTTTAATAFTITPTTGLNYKYFFFRSPTLGADVKVTQIVVKFMPILSSLSISGSHPTVFSIGQTFSSSGLIATGTYDNTATASETGFTTSYDGKVFAKADVGSNKSVTVSYTELGVTATGTYLISVGAIPNVSSIISISAGSSYSGEWVAAGAFTKTSNSGAITYGFTSANITVGTTNQTLKKNASNTSSGWFANTSANNLYARISSIVLTETSNVALVGYFDTVPMVGSVATPSPHTITATSSGTYVKTWTPSASENYTYFLIRDEGNVTAAIVTSIVVNYAPILSTIAVTTPATTTTFDIGQAFNHTGMVVTGTYNNSATAVVNDNGITTNYDGYTFLGSDLGSKTVTITYVELGVSKTTTYGITVRYPALQSIRTSYTTGVGVDQFAVGDTFANVPIYATWSLGSDTLVTSSTTFTIGGVTQTSGVTVLATSGLLTVTASYTDTNNSITKTTTYSIYVFALSSIAISTYPTKSVSGGTNFGLNETFTYSGLAITGTYVYSGKTDITRVKSSGYSTSSPNMLTLGVQTVTVTFVAGGVTKTATYTIKISNAVSSTATDQQKADSLAAYVLAINTCGATNGMVLEMVNEYGYMSSTAKSLFNVKTNRTGNNWSTGTGAKDRYDYLIYLHPNYSQGAANDGSAQALIENSVLPAVLILTAISMMGLMIKLIYSRKRKID